MSIGVVLKYLFFTLYFERIHQIIEPFKGYNDDISGIYFGPITSPNVTKQSAILSPETRTLARNILFGLSRVPVSFAKFTAVQSDLQLPGFMPFQKNLFCGRYFSLRFTIFFF